MPKVKAWMQYNPQVALEAGLPTGSQLKENMSAIQETGATAPHANVMAVVQRQRLQDFFFHKVTWFFSMVVLVALMGIIVSLVVNAWPALSKFGLNFIWRVEWDIVNEEFGAAIAIFGTVISAAIALLIAVPLSFGIALFGVIKLVQSLDDRWSRAKPGFRKIRRKHGAASLVLLGWLDGKISHLDAQQLQRAIEIEVGMPQVARVDDLFAGESFVKSHCSKYKCLLVHVNVRHEEKLNAILNDPRFAAILRKTHALQSDWDTESKAFASEVAPLILNMGADLLHEAWMNSLPK